MPRICPQLPLELLESELLPRLPAKSLGRFRCVSKSWNSILSTPTFAQFHLNYQTNYKLLSLDNESRTTFRMFDWDNSITELPNPFKEAVFILASLDGLVCVALSNTRELAFWNPLTGAYKKFKTSFFDDICGNTAFAFYTDSSNDYKLMHIVSEGAFIYSRRLDLWRKIDTCLDISHHSSDIQWSMDVVFEGQVYFKMETSSPRVISFDVESEKFKEIQLPPFPCGANDGVNLVALNGCIHLYACYNTYNPKGLNCDMWRMDGDGWMKAAVFSRPHSIQFNGQIHTKRNGEWLAIWKDNTSIKSIDLEDFATKFRYYDHLFRWFCERVGAVYIETLVSPNP